jgi:hypothetical protein
MKVLALALLAFSLATPSFAADEHHTTTGSRLSPESSGKLLGGVHGSGPRPCMVKNCGKPDSSEPTFPKRTEITSAEVLVMVMEQWGQMVDLAASKEVWGELNVTVTTKEGTKVEVSLKVGFGTKEVVSAKKK